MVILLSLPSPTGARFHPCSRAGLLCRFVDAPGGAEESKLSRAFRAANRGCASEGIPKSKRSCRRLHLSSPDAAEVASHGGPNQQAWIPRGVAAVHREHHEGGPSNGHRCSFGELRQNSVSNNLVFKNSAFRRSVFNAVNIPLTF